MFETQYNDEMESEIRRIEAKNRALAAGHPEWENACEVCGNELATEAVTRCVNCSKVRLT